MTDYRNRRPPSFERPTIRSVLGSLPVLILAMNVAGWAAIGAALYAVAVVAGLAW